MTEHLPIGTVVRLKSVEKKIMIYGHRQTSSTNGEEYSYVGCPYPEGYLAPEYNLAFNNHLIEEILFKGYYDTENEHFLNYLNAISKTN